MSLLSASTKLRVQCAAVSDTGRRRTNNEDAYLISPENGLFAVADGMGGHAGGEVAAALAIESLRQAVAAAPDADFVAQPSLPGRRKLLAWLSQTVDAINSAIAARVEQNPELHGMGCTLDVALIRGSGLFLAHVGDSRVYLKRGTGLHRLTEDHNLGQMLLSSGVLTPEEQARHPQRNVLTRALGPFPTVQVDTAYIDLAADDVLLLCSDGLYTEVPDEQLQQLLTSDANQSAQALVEAALAAGGRDNVTAAVVRIEACATPAVVIGSELTRAALASSPLFAAFTPSELLRVQKIALGREFAAGQTIIEQGNMCDSFYLVVAGGTSVWRDGQPLGKNEPGDPFGELSFEPQPASVGVRAETTLLALEFPLAEVLPLLSTDTTIAAKLAMATLKRTTKRMRGLLDLLSRHRAAGLIPPND